MVCQLNLLGRTAERVTSGRALIHWKKSGEHCLEISLNSITRKEAHLWRHLARRSLRGIRWPPCYVLGGVGGCYYFILFFSLSFSPHLICWCEEMRISTESSERRSASRRVGGLKKRSVLANLTRINYTLRWKEGCEHRRRRRMVRAFVRACAGLLRACTRWADRPINLSTVRSSYLVATDIFCARRPSAPAHTRLLVKPRSLALPVLNGDN